MHLFLLQRYGRKQLLSVVVYTGPFIPNRRTIARVHPVQQTVGVIVSSTYKRDVCLAHKTRTRS